MRAHTVIRPMAASWVKPMPTLRTTSWLMTPVVTSWLMPMIRAHSHISLVFSSFTTVQPPSSSALPWKYSRS